MHLGEPRQWHLKHLHVHRLPFLSTRCRAAGEGGPPPSSSPHTLGGPLTGLPPTPAATLASSHAGPTPSTQGRGTLDDPILVDELEGRQGMERCPLVSASTCCLPADTRTDSYSSASGGTSHARDPSGRPAMQTPRLP